VVTAEPAILLPCHGSSVSLDTAELRNLFAIVGGNVRRYVEGLFKIDATIRQGITRSGQGLGPPPEVRSQHETGSALATQDVEDRRW
jgi:hypothetical protein